VFKLLTATMLAALLAGSVLTAAVFQAADANEQQMIQVAPA